MSVSNSSLSQRRQRAPAKYSFIGVDLAWAVDSRHSAVAVMEGDKRAVRLVTVSSDLFSLGAVAEFILAHTKANSVVAIDASLIVRNESGQRACETLIGRTFGRFGASCHSTNRSRPHWDSGVRLVSYLERAGYEHGLPLEKMKGRSGRRLVEVYPHPAMVRLFGLDRILRYKKGAVGARRAGLAELQEHLARLIDPAVGLAGSLTLTRLLGEDLTVLKGSTLKAHEDRLDAVFCAFLAWHIWRWGAARNEVFGDLDNGYIVVPEPTAAQPRS